MPGHSLYLRMVRSCIYELLTALCDLYDSVTKQNLQ